MSVLKSIFFIKDVWLFRKSDKMPKIKELPFSEKENIIKLFNENNSLGKIGKLVNRKKSTVQYIINKWKSSGCLDNSSRSGRPKILSPRDERRILKEVSENPFISAQNLANDIAITSGKNVCPETVRKVIRKGGYKGRVARKKPFISEVNRVKRLKFATEYKDKTIDFWKSVIFSDESKFNIFGSDGKKMVWRKKGTALAEKNLLPTVKHGGGHVMVWGCMSSNGVGKLHFIDGIMNAKMYLDILEHNLNQSAEMLGIKDNFYFQQDNDPKHTARIVKEWLLYRVQNKLETPPQSPDINPIENLWAYLDKKVRKHKISNKIDLKRILEKEWYSISSEYTKNLIESIPRRLKAIIENKGLPTKY